MRRFRLHSRRSVSTVGQRGRIGTTVTLVATLLIGFVAPSGVTGAWFTAQASRTDNSLSAASLGPVSGLSATARDDGVNLRWVNAQTQTWATANNVTTGATYTVIRTVDGTNPTRIYTGPATSTSDAYPKARIGVETSTYSAGDGVAGAIVDGSLYTWGASSYGSLGTDTSWNKYPTKVSFPGGRSITNFVYASVGAAAVASDGTVWTWGFNISVPTQAPTPEGSTIVSAICDGRRMVMLDSAGAVWQGARGKTPTRVDLPGGRRVLQITKGQMVLADDGTVWSLGNYGSAHNSSGEWANGTFSDSASPVQAVLPSGTRGVKVASYSRNTAILLDNNTVWTAGMNSRGQLGAGLQAGSTDNNYASLQQFRLPAGETWTDVSVGSSVIGALSSSGLIYIAGIGSTGQLGNGTTATNNNVPVKTYNPDHVSYVSLQLATGGAQSYAADSNGAFWGWGANSTDTPFFGNGDGSSSVFTYPMMAAKDLTYHPGHDASTCPNGGTKNASGYCALTGDVKYTVSYAYFSWSAEARSTTATATPLQTGVATVGGPGGSGLCLNLRNNSSDNGTPVDIATCNLSQPGQQWSTWSDGTFRANGKCLDMKGDTPGSIVQLWPCNGLGYQWWVPRDDGSMYNPTSGLCLTDPSGNATPGTQQVIAKCTGAPSEQWKIT